MEVTAAAEAAAVVSAAAATVAAVSISDEVLATDAADAADEPEVLLPLHEVKAVVAANAERITRSAKFFLLILAFIRKPPFAFLTK